MMLFVLRPGIEWVVRVGGALCCEWRASSGHLNRATFLIGRFSLSGFQDRPRNDLDLVAPHLAGPPGAFTLRGSIASGSPDFLASSLSRAQGRVPGTGTGRDPGSGSIEPDQEARFSGGLWSMERVIIPPGKITLSVAESDVAHVGMPLILPRGEKRERALRSSPSRWFMPRLICLKSGSPRRPV